MTVSQLINNLNSFHGMPAYENEPHCSDSQKTYFITDIAFFENNCFVFYQYPANKYYQSVRSLVADLRTYSHQQNYQVEFVNYNTNETFFNCNFHAVHGYNLTLRLY